MDADINIDWTVECIFDNQTGIRFAYTVGLTDRGLPELLVIGRTHPMTLGSMLNYVALDAIKKGYLGVGSVDVGLELKTGGDLRAAVRDVTDVELVGTKYATKAAVVYQLSRRPLRFMQLVFADGNNILPGEVGYSTAPVYEQPLV